ncbi:hypothetical protein AURDEDRAFT_120231 [Auricularia subglabra TFB-10046 SS5]|nr:hypothetical protein AURDEDRAFT_120231 [Auricularia subglabra TFB-10046 SS5]
MRIAGTPASEATAVSSIPTTVVDVVWTHTNIGLCCIVVVLSLALLALLARWFVRGAEFLRIAWLARNLNLPSHELAAMSPTTRRFSAEAAENATCRLGCARCAFSHARWNSICKAASAARTDVDTYYMMEKAEGRCDCASSTPGTSPDLVPRTPELIGEVKLVARAY